MNVILKNNFHNTAATVRMTPGKPLSRRAAKRVQDTLCGMQECCCGGLRGPQVVAVEERGASYCTEMGNEVHYTTYILRRQA